MRLSSFLADSAEDPLALGETDLVFLAVVDFSIVFGVAARRLAVGACWRGVRAGLSSPLGDDTSSLTSGLRADLAIACALVRVIQRPVKKVLFNLM